VARGRRGLAVATPEVVGRDQVPDVTRTDHAVPGDPVKVPGPFLTSPAVVPGPTTAPPPPRTVERRDKVGRPLRDLRISVTDRCNFRCSYCMPKERFGTDATFLPHADVLTRAEIVRVARLLVAEGVEKIRITGGEPLVRPDLPGIVEDLAALSGLRDLSVTTNGSLLAARARDLRDAGLRRVTVSLDSLDDGVFGRLNGVHAPVWRVLDGVEAALAAGLSPVKVNMLVQRGVNDACVLPMAGWARERGVNLRLIEYMDVGTANGWRPDDVVPAAELLGRIGERWPLDALPARYPGEVATRFRYRDGGAELGVIASVSAPFCGDCTRMRLGPDGRLYTCLFATRGHDVRGLLRSGASDAELARAMIATWAARDDRYSELRATALPGAPASDRVEMFAIGG
jgi:GTP 3',8-cyclase